MKKIIRILSIILVFSLCLTIFNNKVAYAATISIDPTEVRTRNDSTKVTVTTGGLESYVRYTSTTDRPSLDLMWRIPAGQPNIQDFVAPGEWYLHVYIPATGQWRTTGPYLKENAPPTVPIFQSVPIGWVKDPVTYTINCKGDNGQSGYDNINDRYSYFESGFLRNETWENGASKPQQEGALTNNIQVVSEGWHEEWARAIDKVGNESDWAKAEFGIDYHPPTINTPVATGGDGISVNITNMQDHGLSGNKKLHFTAYKQSDPSNKATKEQIVIQEGGNATIKFSSSELGGYSKDTTYIIEVVTEDQVGNMGKYTVTITGDESSTEGPPDIVPPTDPDTPVPDDPGEVIPDGKLGKIKFDLNETIWSNKGKDGEGEGKYPVKVWYTGDNPYKTNGVATIEKEKTDDEGNTTTVTTHKNIPVYFPLERIEVTEDAEETIDGDSGKINIEKEGYQLNLHGEGFWGDPEYNEPDGCVSVDYKDPPNPVGDSKEYNIDWSKPEIDFNIKDKIFSEKNGAIRKESILGKDDSFYGKLTVTDNLSGTKFIEYKWTYGAETPNDGYTRIYESENTNTDKSDEVLENLIEKPVGDNLYLHVRAGDIAGDNEGNKENDTYECFGPYEDPIKLRDFQVTDIRDPRWQDVFWNDTEYKDYKDVTFKTNSLPVDEESHPTLRNAYPKKGYAFYFDMTSEYLYREKDRIEIVPSFYYVNSKNKRVPLDMYYNKNNNPLIQSGSKQDDIKLNLETKKYGSVWIGGIDKLTLTKGVRICNGREWLETGGWKDEIQYVDGKIQWWYGKYLIPSTSIFVKQGDTPRPENIINAENIIVNFQIVGYKDGIETLSLDQIFGYVPSQWEEEGGPKNSNYKSGDVMVYDNKYSALSDYSAHVIQ